MTHHDDDVELRALLRATDEAVPLNPERETALHARIVAGDDTVRAMLSATDTAHALTADQEAQLAARIASQGAGWLALRAQHAAETPADATLDLLAARIRADALPVLSRYRRPMRRSPWVTVAVRWSRPALPLAIAAGLGAMMVLMRTPRTADGPVTEAVDATSAYAAVGEPVRVSLASMTPEGAIGDGPEATP